MNSSQEISTIEPLVSVGIPTYNRPEGLRRTLQCITGQTYKNLEIIVSDNCSPGPDTEMVVREFMAGDSRIQYYRQVLNKGATFNFQFVLEKATGEYFMWAADDDEWDKKYIGCCASALISDCHAVLSFSEPYFQKFKGWELYSHEINITTEEFLPLKAAYKLLFSIDPFTAIYGLIRKSALKKIPMRDRYGYDQTMVLCLIVMGKFMKVEKGLFIYGTRGVSESMEKMIISQKLDINTRYFSQIYMMQDMIFAIFTYDLKLKIYQKLLLGVLIISRNILVKQRLLSIIGGTYSFIKDSVKYKIRS